MEVSCFGNLAALPVALDRCWGESAMGAVAGITTARLLAGSMGVEKPGAGTDIAVLRRVIHRHGLLLQ